MTGKVVFLVDTNSYLRVAKSSDSILGDHASFELRLITEIANECNRSARLQRLWPWLQEPPHPETRKRWTMKFTPAQQAAVRKSKEELRDPLEDVLDEFAAKKHAKGDFRPVLSPPDLAVFCTAEALRFGVVTDEAPMSVACKEFDVPHMSTLELLHKLVQQRVLTRAKVDTMVRYWQFEKDAPTGWRAQYKRLFGPPIPEFTLDD